MSHRESPAARSDLHSHSILFSLRSAFWRSFLSQHILVAVGSRTTACRQGQGRCKSGREEEEESLLARTRTPAATVALLSVALSQSVTLTAFWGEAGRREKRSSLVAFLTVSVWDSAVWLLVARIPPRGEDVLLLTKMVVKSLRTRTVRRYILGRLGS